MKDEKKIVTESTENQTSEPEVTLNEELEVDKGQATEENCIHIHIG